MSFAPLDLDFQNLISRMKRRGSTENINNNEIIRSLYTFLKEIPFFKLNFPDSFQLHSFLTKSKDSFIYNHYSLGDIVFHYGDEADRFYIIIKGSASVWIPSILDNISTNENDLNLFQNYFLNYSQYFKNNKFLFKRINNLSEKQCFGELAISNNKPRTATILANEDLELLSITKNDFCNFFQKNINEFQKKVEFFGNLIKNIEGKDFKNSSSSLMRFGYYFDFIEYSANRIIFLENDMSDGLYFIENGEIELFLTKDNLEYESKKLKISNNLHICKLSKFGYFGENYLINKSKKREYNAKTVSTSSLFYLNSKKFYQFIKAFPFFIESLKLSLIWRKTRIETIQSLRLNENFPFYPFKNIPKRSKTKTYETDSESFRLSKEEKYSNKEMSFIVCQNLKIFEKINKFPFKYKQNNIEKPFFLQDISYSIKNKNLKTSPKTSVNYSLDFIKRRMTETKIKDNSNLNLNFQRNTSFSNILNNKTKRYVDCHRPSTHQSGSGKKKLQNFLKAIKT